MRYLPLLLLPSFAFAAPLRTHYDRAFYAPSEEVVTPHIPWLKPYSRGPVRTLFIIHRQNQREVIEIAQRLQMDYTVFCAEDPERFGETGIGVDMGWRLVEGNSTEELTKQLQGLLQKDYDVIVVGNVKWDTIPLDCRYEILRKVKAGTGLVGYMPSGHDVYMSRIMQDAKFGWTYANWSGEAQGIADFFGIGDFVGSVDTHEAHSGQCSVRVIGREVKMGSKEPPRGGYMFAPVKAEPHTKYHFSAWYRNDATGRANISLYPAADSPTPPSDTWKQTEVTWDSGDKTEFGVYLLNTTVGSVWFDDVSLTKAGDPTNLLPNPGFENPGPVPEALTGAYPYASLPAFRAQPSPEAFARSLFGITHFGEGRVCLFQGIDVPITQIMTPAPQGDMRTGQLDYDYYLMAAVRAIAWGAKKEPEVSLTTPQPLVTLARARLSSTPVIFHVASARPGAYAYLRTVRDRTNRVWSSAAAEFSLKDPAGLDLAVKVPALPAGSYFVDLTIVPVASLYMPNNALIKRDTAVLAISSGSVGLEVTSPVHIEKLELSKAAFSQSEPLTGKATLAGAAPGLSLVFRAFDNLDRLVAQVRIPAASAQVPFSLKPTTPSAITGRIVAALTNGANVLDRREIRYSLTDFYPDPRDLRQVMWTSPGNDFISPYVLREFKRAGVDTQYTGFSELVPAANLWHIPMPIRFDDTKTDWYNPKPSRDKTDLIRDPCLTDPKYLATVKDALTKCAEEVRPYSTSEFSLGDECMFVSGNYDLCMSPTCNADFREFLKRDYGSLDKMNAEWGTAYATWEDVVPITIEDARKTGHFAQWVDHRRHMESIWAGIYGFSRDTIRQVIPKARVGYEGSDTEVGSFHANDYWKLAQVMDFNNIYYRDFLTNAVRDFSPPNMLLGAGWYGGYASNRNEPYMRWFPWRALFKGSNSLWVWMGYGTAGAVLAYDLSPYPFYKANAEEVAEIKSGPAKLLLSSERQHDGIAVLWSASSVHAAELTPGFPAMDSALNDLVQVIHDIGLECKIVSYDQLAEGKVTPKEFKTLILPGCQAMSQAECAAVRTFAETGGMVLADLRPAVYDEHGKPCPDGSALDTLFGVKTDTSKFARTSGDLPIGNADLVLKGVIADASVTANAGAPYTTLGKTPVIIGRSIGKGQAVLLNFAFPGYASLGGSSAKAGDFGSWAPGEPIRQFMAGTLAISGVKPPVRLSPLMPQVEISRFRSGNAEYVGIVQGLPGDTTDYTNLLAKPLGPKPVTVTLPRKAFVYDVRQGQYLGETNSLSVLLQPGIAKLYALLPYKVASVSLAAPPTPARLGVPVQCNAVVSAGNAKIGTHCLHVTVFDPAGRARDCYTSNVLARGGRGIVRFTPALNDPPGVWKVIVRDVATGMRASAPIAVQ